MWSPAERRLDLTGAPRPTIVQLGTRGTDSTDSTDSTDVRAVTAP